MDSLIFELQIVFYFIFNYFCPLLYPIKYRKDIIIDSLKYIRECMKKTKYGVNEI